MGNDGGKRSSLSVMLLLGYLSQSDLGSPILALWITKKWGKKTDLLSAHELLRSLLYSLQRILLLAVASNIRLSEVVRFVFYFLSVQSLLHFSAYILVPDDNILR